MKKLGIVLLTLLSFSIYSQTPVSLMESNNVVDESIHDAFFNGSTHIKRQFFTATENYTLTEVLALMYRVGDPNCFINVSIHTVLDSIILGIPISTGTLESTNLSLVGEWHTWTMTEIFIESGLNYCLQITVTDFDSPNQIAWSANTDVALDQYLMYSYDGGATFGGPVLSNDYMFEVYGWAGPDLRHEVGIIWNASTDNVGVTGYNIWVDAEYFATSPDTTYTLKLLPGTYVVAVSAFDAAGNESGWSESIVITIGEPDIEAPTIPENIMTIIPNPIIAQFDVILKRPVSENSSLQILSPTGHVLFDRTINVGETNFVVNKELPSGVYVILLIEDGKRIDNTHLIIS